MTQYSEDSKVSDVLYKLKKKIFRVTSDIFSSIFTFQYYAEVKVDGEVKGQRVENPEPMQFTDVKVWMSTGQYGFPPANVFIRNLQY